MKWESSVSLTQEHCAKRPRAKTGVIFKSDDLRDKVFCCCYNHAAVSSIWFTLVRWDIVFARDGFESILFMLAIVGGSLG